jgi:shikimate kinase
MNIFLVGLPASGKTTLGKKLARFLNYEFLDTDDLIKQRERVTIEDIFDKRGEDAFRTIEKEILETVIHLKDKVISTGGGMPCFHGNMDRMNEYGTTIFLDVPVKDLLMRLGNDGKENRPLTRGKNEVELYQFLENKYKERSPFYKRAKIILEGNKIKLENIVEALNIESQQK